MLAAIVALLAAGAPAAGAADSSCRPPDGRLDRLASGIKRHGPSFAGVRGHRRVATRPTARKGKIAVGIQTVARNLRDAPLDARLGKLRAAGLTLIREDFLWSQVQPEPGTFCWEKTDRLVSAAARAGMTVIAIPDASPSWIGARVVTPPLSKSAVVAYAGFVREIVGRYGTFGSFWTEHRKLRPAPIRFIEIWNEPYSRDFWDTDFPNVGAYGFMFTTAVRAAERLDPRARFLLGADTTALTPAQVPFLAPLLESSPDIVKYADGLSVHPYTSNGWGPEVCDTDGDLAARRFEFCRLKDIRAILADHGAAELPLWITEMGYSTAPSSKHGVSEADAAAKLRATFATLREPYAGPLRALIWYAYSTSEASPSKLGDHFGIVRKDGRTTPAWDALLEESRTGIPLRR